VHLTTTVDFDPGTGIYNLSSIGGINTFISKLDSTGNFIWANQLKGSNNIGLSIKLDSIRKNLRSWRVWRDMRF
jgi:hypothetical protein